MTRDIPTIVLAADIVRCALQTMATEGKVEAAAVRVKNLAWVLDMQGREAWMLTLDHVEPKTEEVLIRGIMYELELRGLGWDDWDIYTEG